MPNITRLRNRVALCCLILFFSVSTAQAAVFTIDGPIAVNDAASGVIGTLSPVSAVPGGTFTNEGAFSGDILLVEFSLSAGSSDIDQFAIGAGGVNPIGGLFYDGTGTQAPNQTGGQPIELPGSTAVFNFEHLSTVPGNLNAGESTGVLGAVFNLGDLPPPGIVPPGILVDTATFTISSGANFSVSALVVVVPEPATAMLVGFGLMALASARRR